MKLIAIQNYAAILAKHSLGATVAAKATRDDDPRWVSKLTVAECRDFLLLVRDSRDYFNLIDHTDVQRLVAAAELAAFRLAEES